MLEFEVSGEMPRSTRTERAPREGGDDDAEREPPGA
jgi:hypothetical protein